MNNKPTAKLILADSNEGYEFSPDCDSLLDCLEKEKIDIPFQCREGYCGACRAKLIDGRVSYNQEPLAFIRDGEVLLCCTKPVGDIKIKL